MIPYKINSENLLLIFPLLFLGLSKIQAQNISKRADTIRALQNATPQQNQQIQEGTQQKIGPETASTPATGRHNQPVTYQSTNKAAKSNVFGSEFFNTTSLSFEPNLRISTPINYLLGPDDHVIVNIYGNSLANWDLQINPDGNINIPGIGILNIASKTIEKATEIIKYKLIQNRYAIGNGTFLSVSLGNIRSINITVIGGAKPGNYTLSSLSTVFNSLYVCGGPGAINTYRNIELLRGGKLYQKIDMYQFLTRGNQKGNVLLQEGDVINFPVYKKMVDVGGEVNRPGTFELKEDETFENLLFFAGGYTVKAYKAIVKVKQVTDTERKIRDLTKAEILNYIPSNGDSFTVDSILDRVENSISISGAVYRPGEFELTPGTTISSLIKRAGGLMENVFTDRATITRVHVDGKTENISFNVSDVMNNIGDISLIKRDVVFISTLNDFVVPYTFNIEGEVKKPAAYPYSENLTLKDALFKAGGFTDAASLYNVDVSRRLQKSGTISITDSIATIHTLNVSNSLAIENDRFALKPFDIITVRRNPGYVEQQKVTINGEVNFPGPYVIQSKNERISDVLKRAGGLTPFAYKKGIYLTRRSKNENLNEQVEIVKNIQSTTKDTSAKVIEDITKTNSRIPINFEKITTNPTGIENYILLNGDVIEVLKVDPLVKISGEVLVATRTGYIENKSLDYYITQAGGTNLKARRSKIYVLYADGHIRQTSSGLFGLFRSKPKIEAGSEVIVPRKEATNGLKSTEIVALSTGITSLVTLVIIAITNIKK